MGSCTATQRQGEGRRTSSSLQGCSRRSRGSYLVERTRSLCRTDTWRTNTPHHACAPSMLGGSKRSAHASRDCLARSAGLKLQPSLSQTFRLERTAEMMAAHRTRQRRGAGAGVSARTVSFLGVGGCRLLAPPQCNYIEFRAFSAQKSSPIDETSRCFSFHFLFFWNNFIFTAFSVKWSGKRRSM